MPGGAQAGKGGGARKFGQNQTKCDKYRKREQEGKTRKMMRITKRLKKGETFRRWDKHNAREVDIYVLGSHGRAVKVN